LSRKPSTSPPPNARTYASANVGNEVHIEEDLRDSSTSTSTPVAGKTTSVAEFFPPTPSNSNTAIAKKKATVVLNRSQSFGPRGFHSADADDSDTNSNNSKNKPKKAVSMRRLTNILRWQR